MRSYTSNVVFFNNTVAPYRIPMFNKVVKILAQNSIFTEVVFLSEKESVRNWNVDYSQINFDYEILPTLFQKRNSNTTTSDFIVNRGFFKYLASDVVVLFGYNYPTYLIIIFLRKLLGRKTVLFSESTQSDKPRVKGLKHTVKSFIIGKLFSSYIVPGLEAKEFIKSYGVNDSAISIAENAVEGFAEPEIKKSDSDYINILYVGRLAEEKNVGFLLASIPENHSYNYRVVVVGSGPEEAKLQKIPVQYPVEFKGFREGNELTKIFFEADVFVLPSQSEPWGLVVNEAINAGLAVLVSDRVGCRHELVKNNGRIFKLNDKVDFQNKLLEITSNIDNCKESSRKMSKIFTLDNQASKIAKAIKNA